jgi:hypothetical protein
MTDVEQAVYAYAMKHKTISTARIAAGTGLDVSEVQAVLSKVGTPKEILLSNGWSDDVLTPRRVETLETAIKLTAGDRNKAYGPVKQNFQRIADLWTAYLDCETIITAEDAAWMMVLLKMARSCQPGYHPDNYTDAAAYAAIAGECREIEEANNERNDD